MSESRKHCRMFAEGMVQQLVQMQVSNGTRQNMLRNEHILLACLIRCKCSLVDIYYFVYVQIRYLGHNIVIGRIDGECHCIQNVSEKNATNS